MRGIAWMMAVLSAGCTAELLPVQVPGPVLRVEATGLPGAVSAIAASDVAGAIELAVGGGETTTLLLVHDSGAWSPATPPTGWVGPIRDLTRGPDGDLLLVGDGTIAHGVLGGFAAIEVPTHRRYTGADALAAGRYLVSGEGIALLVTSTSATPLSVIGSSTAAFDATLFDVLVRSPREAYFAGDGGLILAFDGAALHREPVETSDPIRALAGAPNGSIYAVGGSTTAVVLTRDGRGWTRIPTPSLLPLYGATVDDEGALWVGGENGTLARYDGVTWTPITTRLDGEGLRALHASPRGITIGGDSVIARYGR